jgi:hypothetical protein
VDLGESEALLLQAKDNCDATASDLAKAEALLLETKDNWNATASDLAKAEEDVATVEAKLLASEAALAKIQQNLTVCTSHELSSGSKKSSSSAGIAALAATLVVVVIVAVALIRKLAGQVANLKRHEPQPGRRDTLPITNCPMVYFESQHEEGKRTYEQFQIGREAEYEELKAAEVATYTDLDGIRQQYSNFMTGTTA